MVDVLLLCPKSDRPFHYKYVPLSPPLGLGYIAKVLDMNHISFKLYDCYCTPLTKNDIKLLIEELKPKMVGFLVYTESVGTTEKICEMVKEINPSILTVVGGPHATFQGKQMVEKPCIDIAILHEGEEAIIEIYNEANKQNPNYEGIDGIAYKEGDRGCITKPRAPIHDIDKYGYPKREWFPHIERYLEPSTIISSRGCPGQCSFCGGANISGGKYRVRSIESIQEEAGYLKKMFPNDVTIFWDDAFGYDLNRLTNLCQMFQQIQPFKWSCGIRVDRVNKQILQMMSDSGCKKINFGVESGSQKILNETMKNISLDQIRQAVKWAYEADIYNSCSIIIGHPGETHETAQETLKFADEILNNGATSCTFNALVPFPGTYVYEKRTELPIKIKATEWEEFNFLNPVFETEELELNDLRKYIVSGLMLWGKYKNNRDKIHGRLRKRDAILLGEFLGRNVQT